MDLDWLIGKACSRITVIAEGVFAFEFGDGIINVACAWRILDKGHIALAHRDHRQPYGRAVPIDAPVAAMRLLSGKPVVAAFAQERIGDIRVEFEDSYVLEVFNDSSGYEAWSMTDPEKYVWVAASGGDVSGYPGA